MVDVDVYEIDGEKFYLLAEEEIMGSKYLYLSNVDDEEDIMIRKRDKDDPEVLLPLESKEEVKKAATVFAGKMLGIRE